MDEFELPPIIAVRRFLRQQRKRKQAYRDWFDMVNERDWQAGKLRGTALHRFAYEYEEQLDATGAFSIERTGGPDRLKLRASRGYEVRGRALWPISLGRISGGPADASSEDAVMLMRLGAEFAANKAAAHEAPLNFCLTRHAMERLVERGAVVGDFGTALTASLPELTDDSALALACGIAKEIGEGDDWTRTAYVPHRGGLVVLTNRLLAGPLYAEDFGWRFSFTKQRVAYPYLKRDLVMPAAAGASDGAFVSTWCVTTFLAREQLSPDQISYVDAFASWRGSVPDSVTKWAFSVQFDPDFTYRAHRSVPGKESIDERAVRFLRDMVGSSAFRAHPREPIAYLLEADTSTRAFRARLHAQPSVAAS